MTDQAAEPVRGIIEEVKHDKSWGPRLKTLADGLSEGDKSVLIALLQSDDGAHSTALTSRGSANDWFWALMSNVGLMEIDEDAVPPSLRSLTIGYKITNEGRLLLPGLLPNLF